MSKLVVVVVVGLLCALLVATAVAQDRKEVEETDAEEEEAVDGVDSDSESESRIPDPGEAPEIDDFRPWSGCQLINRSVGFLPGKFLGCKPLDPIYRTFCFGSCYSSASINPFFNPHYVRKNCRCCEPRLTKRVNVGIECPRKILQLEDAKPRRKIEIKPFPTTYIRKFTYSVITECRCLPCQKFISKPGPVKG